MASSVVKGLINGHSSKADPLDLTRQFRKSRLSFHSQYLSKPWIAETTLLNINSFHDPNCTQTVHNDPDSGDTCQPLSKMSTIVAELNNLTSAVTRSPCLCLASRAAYRKGKLWKCSHMLKSPIMHTENIPEAPELGTPCYYRQNFGPSSVHYNGAPLYHSMTVWWIAT